MKIIIDDKYLIEVDERNYTVKEKYQAKDKEGNTIDAYKSLKYYRSLDQALHCLNRLKLSSGDDTVTLDKYIRLYKESLDELIRVVKRGMGEIK